MSARDWKKMLVSAQEGDLEDVKYYIELGVNPNYQHPELLTTPLIESIQYQHYSIVEYLLKHGADPTLKAGFSEDSPLSIARQTKNKEIIQLIEEQAPRKKLISRIYNKIISALFGSVFRKYTSGL